VWFDDDHPLVVLFSTVSGLQADRKQIGSKDRYVQNDTLFEHNDSWNESFKRQSFLFFFLFFCLRSTVPCKNTKRKICLIERENAGHKKVQGALFLEK
jgi:hypothetical protein